MSKLYNYLRFLDHYGTTPDTLITEEMFDDMDIIDLSVNDGKTFVKFRGLNGTIPITFFSEPAQHKIRIWLKKRNTPLGKVLHG